MDEKDGLKSLNETTLGELSLEEIEARLKVEDLDPQGELWTGCGCENVCSPDVGPCPDFGQPCPQFDCPQQGCVPYVCWRGTW
jgi:hypothetical protein